MSLVLSLRISRQKSLQPILSIPRNNTIHPARYPFHSSTTTYKKREQHHDIYKPAKPTLHKSNISFPEVYPRLFALPIMRKPLFPGFYKSMFIRDPVVVSVLQGLIQRGQPYIGVFLIKQPEVDIDIITSVEQVYHTGVFAQISHISSATQNDENGHTVLLFPHRRIKMKELVLTSDIQFMGKYGDQKRSLSSFNLNKNDLLEEHMISIANVENLVDPPFPKHDPTIQTMVSEILHHFKEVARLNPSFHYAKVLATPTKLPDFIATGADASPSEFQQVLDSTTLSRRLQLSIDMLKRQVDHVRLQQHISKTADAQITKQQVLLSALKKTEKELGMDEVVMFKERASRLTGFVQKIYQEELVKFSSLQPHMPEYTMTRDYLDWISQLPWGKHTTETQHLHRARQILEEGHSGLQDVKAFILEWMATRQLGGSMQGKILCLCGPPGVGKTSIAGTIARALDRPLFRFSVGGLTDVAEIKGHRRTYVGAMPGKMIHALKRVQAENPLILLDEVDKMGNAQVSSSLLELLDPEQHHQFLDHYLDIPVDLSKVLFVCTANTLNTIPTPLLDRMEVVRLPGYTNEEKATITLRHLIPACQTDTGLQGVSLTEEAVHAIIRGYCRESGVRNLRKQIEKIFRKVAFQIAQGQEEIASLKVDAGDLKYYLGPEVYRSDKLYEKQLPTGVVMGLGIDSPLFIESVLEPHYDEIPQLLKTGNLGDIMKESTAIAYTFAKSFLARHFQKNTFFDTARIHLHCPSGSTPKDDPSAGIAMTTSLLSLAFNIPVSSNIAMTGEMTITGKVLRVDDLREKILAAKQSNMDIIVFPADNQQEWDMLDDHMKKGMTGVPVASYHDVFQVVFRDASLK